MTFIVKQNYWYISQISGERIKDHWSSGFKLFCFFFIFQFEYKDTRFTFDLVRVEELPESVEITVDGEKMNSTEIIEQLPMYRGASLHDGVYIHCNIMLTHDGIEGTVRFRDESVTIEPLINQNRDSCARDCVDRLEVFPCIFYRPEDVNNSIDRRRDSYLLPINQHVSKQNFRDGIHKRAKSRKKRSITYTECTLHIVADHTFWTAVGGKNVVNTVAAMMHDVIEANVIFRSTDFNGDGSGDYVGVGVKKITVYTTNEYHMVGTSGTSAYLNKFADYDFNDVCLGACWAHRNWGSTIGLAYSASSDPLKQGNGGICSKNYPPYSMKNYNTLVISAIANGRVMPVIERTLVLTHELGHAFGSQHDETAACKPGGTDGHYLMYPYNLDGSRPNHHKFSPCSIDYIYPCLTVAGKCLKKTTSMCGNGLVEPHEECDCGKSTVCDLIDPSCTPKDGTYPDSPCTFRSNGVATTTTTPTTTTRTTTTTTPTTTTRTTTTTTPTTTTRATTTTTPSKTTTKITTTTTGTLITTSTTTTESTVEPALTSVSQSPTRLPCQCSVVYSPCCTADCQFAPPSQPCRFAGECVKPQNCSGTSGSCPQIINEPDGKLCYNNRKTCLAGKCFGSICSLLNATECDCDPGSFECYVCCKKENSTCSPAIIDDSYTSKLIGNPCHDLLGFCDEHMTCILLEDPHMDFVQFGMVFSPKTVNDVSDWLSFNWYYIVAGLIGLLLVATVFYATCQQRFDVQTTAFMYGQFMRLKHEADVQKRYIEDRKRSLVSEYNGKMVNVDHVSKRMGLTKALERMREFFPTTPDHELKKVLKVCATEEMAVYLILMKLFPLRKVKTDV